jgi:hypothetical protein
LILTMLVLLAWPPHARAACPAPDSAAPRTLVIALDGVPYRVVEQARQQGAFEGWPETRPLVSTFPSMTNVGFTAILEPLGARPIGGYERRYYDAELNKVWGSGQAASKKTVFAWTEYFQVKSRSYYDKARIYLAPRSKSLGELGDVEALALEAPTELMLAHVAATDSLTHLRGDEATVEVVVEMSRRIEALRRDHEQRHGRPLRIVLLSDHGNTTGKVSTVRGIRDLLREAGLRPAKKLERPDDVVPVTYGVVGYGTLFLRPEHAEAAARAVLGHPGVQLAAWVSGAEEIRLAGPGGEAVIRWRDEGETRRLSYRDTVDDPLLLSEIVSGMEQDGLLDAKGYASAEAWFDTTASHEFPDPLTRIVDSITGTYVTNAATVIFSLAPGWGWGVPSARFGASMVGGKLEATHGGLDRESTWGFFLRSDPYPDTAAAVRADLALTEWSDLPSCADVSMTPGALLHADLHLPRILGP